MKSIRFALILLALPLVASSYDDGDFQAWFDLYATYPLSTNLTARFEQEMWLGDDASEDFYHHSDISVIRRLCANADLALAFRHVEMLSGDEWRAEERPHAAVTLKAKADNWSFEDRNRFEYRTFDYKDDFLRYRNRLQVSHPAKMGTHSFTPYASEELFADSDTGDINQFRTIGGVKFRVSERVRSDVYYMWQTVEREGEWTDTHIAGLAIGYAF